MFILSTPGHIFIYTVVLIISTCINQNEVKRNGTLKETRLEEGSPAAVR